MHDSADSSSLKANQPPDVTLVNDKKATEAAVSPEISNPPSNTRKARVLRHQMTRRRLVEKASQQDGCSRFWNRMSTKNSNDMMLKNYIRVNGSSRRLCYTQDEMTMYENDQYYRAYMIGSMIGATLYHLCAIYLILPETRGDMQFVREWRLAQIYLPTYLSAILAVHLVKYVVIRYLNAYIILVSQIAVFILAVLGGFQYSCPDEGHENTSITSGGQTPLFLMGLVETIFGLKEDKMREQLLVAKCDPTVVRMTATQIMGELLNLICSIALITNQA